MTRDYRQLAVPRGLMDRVQALVEGHPELGYRTPSEAAIEGIRWWIGMLEDRTEKLLATRERQAGAPGTAGAPGAAPARPARGRRRS